MICRRNRRELREPEEKIESGREEEKGTEKKRGEKEKEKRGGVLV